MRSQNYIVAAALVFYVLLGMVAIVIAVRIWGVVSP